MSTHSDESERLLIEFSDDPAEESVSAALREENERLRKQHQAALDCINLYGDKTLHDALDAIGWPFDARAVDA